MNTLFVTIKSPLGYQWEADDVLCRTIADVNNRLDMSNTITVRSSIDGGLELLAKGQRPEDVFGSVKSVIDLIPAELN